MFLVDLTKAFPGEGMLDETLTSVKAYCQTKGIPEDKRIVFCRPAQVAAIRRTLQSRDPVVVEELNEQNSGSAGDVTPRYVRDYLLSIDPASVPDGVTIASYSGWVLNLPRRLQLPFQVSTISLGDVKKEAALAGVAMGQGAGPANLAAGSNHTGSSGRLSRRMEDHLRSAHMGPFAKLRPALYDCIDKTPPDNETVGAFLTRIVAGARGLVSVSSDKYPWSEVRIFLGTVLTRVPALLDADGKAVPDDLSTLNHRIVALTPGWQEQCEAELLLELLAPFVVDRLTLRDVALALHHNAEAEDGLRKVEETVSFLVDSGQALVDANGRLIRMSEANNAIESARAIVEGEN